MSVRVATRVLALATLVLATQPAGARPPAGWDPPAGRGRTADPFGIAGTQSVDGDRRMDANRINMWSTNYGSFAWDIAGSSPGLVWPRGTSQTSVFASGLWLGCLVGTDIRTVVAEYSQEYGPGRMLGGTFDDPSHPDFRTYKVSRYRGDASDTAHVERAVCYPEDPLVHHSWSEYMLGAVPYGAPWKIHRLPDTSTPAPGDSVDVAGPDVLGDQMLWSVYNDADPARHTSDAGLSTPLGVEIQQSLFSFDRSDELGNVAFLRFRIHNKGGNTLDSLYVSLWSDPDLGGASDDLTGCDVARALGFAYNATGDDAIYGRPAPAVGYVLLRGPVNPSDGVPLGLTAFDRWINGTDPASTSETYNYMRGLLPDGGTLTDPMTGLPTRYFHSGDPVTGLGWLDSGPADRRMLLTSGPSRMLPGETQEVWAAIVIGRGGDHLSSVGTVRCLADLAHTAYQQSFSPLPTPASPCSTSAVALAASCPSPVGFWARECGLGGDRLTPQQLDQAAAFVNAQATLFDWPAETHVQNYCATVDTTGSPDLRQQARREFAAFLANYSGALIDLSLGGGGRVWLNPLTNISAPPLRAGTIAELAETVSLAPGFRDAAYLDDNDAHRRALDGVDAGLSGFGGGAAPAFDFFGSSLDPAAAPDSFVTVEVRFDRTTTQKAYRYLRLERQSDGAAPPQGRAYLYAGHHTVPFTCWDVQNDRQLDVGFVERAATDDLGNLLGAPFQPATHDSTWGPDDSIVGGREYLFVFRRPYSPSPKPALAQDGLVASGSAPALYALWSRLRTASDVIDDGDRFQFLWGRIPSRGADSLLVELEGQSLLVPAVQQAYSDLIGSLARINAGIGIGQSCTSGPTPGNVLTAVAGPNGTITPYGAVGAPTGTSRSFTISTTCPGYAVANVLVDGSPVGPVTRYTFDNVTTNHTIVASFAAAGPTIMASAGPNGTIIPSGPVPVADGGTQSFYFVANQGSRVTDVLVDNSSVGAITSYTFTDVTAPHTIEARFALDPALSGTGWADGGVPVSTASGDQEREAVIADGSGGVIIAWRDLRSGTADIYAQRLNGSGVPQWTPQGVPVCTATGDQVAPLIVGDGAGGVVLTWQDPRGGFPAIYAQRLSAAGSPLWAPNGVSLCSGTHEQSFPVIASDGAGGAIVAWSDLRSGTQIDLYAQRVSAVGELLWPSSGLPVMTGPRHEQNPQVVSDGLGGVFLAWSDGRNDPANPDVFATRLTGTGTFAPGWSPGGLAISTAPFSQGGPRLVSDGAGGAFILWLDLPTPTTAQVFAQRVSSAGVPLWAANGINLAPGSNPSDFRVVADGAGGAIAAWSDFRSGVATQDIYAQRLRPDGTRAWTTSGAPLCTASGTQGTLSLAPDGSGGAIVAWEDNRLTWDIFAQRVDSTGSPRWPLDGIAVSAAFATSLGIQALPAIAPDGTGGGLIAWMDQRSGGWDIYTQRISPDSLRGFDHAIMATAGANGSIAPAGSVGVFRGSAQSFAITPAGGHSIAGVLIDDDPVGAVTQYTFTNITADHTISASFAADSVGPPISTEGAYLLASYGFDDPRGGCRPRGWTGQDRSSRVYAHVASRFLLNDPFIAMGTRALWFGADSASALDEIRDWVRPYGFGNGWSQRLTSPAFSRVTYPRAVLRFDAHVDFTGSGGLQPGIDGNDFLAVQGLTVDGSWSFLNGRRIESGSPAVTEPAVGGRGDLKYEARLGLDGNESLPLAEPLRLRIVVQTDGDGSSEDGLVVAGIGAAVIDNVTLRDSLVSVLAATDFEGGGLGGWTLSALNGTYGEGASAVVRDVPSPGTLVQLRAGYDDAAPSCAWTFASAGDTLPVGAFARLVSPWIALAAPDSQVLISFAGRLNTLSQGRAVSVIVRGKRAGDPNPRHASRHVAPLVSGAVGGDEASPFLPERVLRYPQDFFAPQSDDSIQVVFQVEDPVGTLGRTPTRLPFLDDIRILQPLADTDGDGVADVIDPCPTVSATGQDADGDGCVDSTATMRHVESWGRGSYPVTYTIAQGAAPAITDSSDFAAVRAGFDAWILVPEADVPVVEGAVTTQTEAAALDGVNLVTFTDADFGFPPSVLAVTPTTSFTRRAAFDDRIALPGEIVDSDLMFNPASSFSTPTQAGDHDLRSVATHEIGHLLGLGHSGVLDATMFFVLQPGTSAASLTADDVAALAAAYPGPGLATSFGTITGTVLRGSDGMPLPGALVTAVRLNGAGAPLDSSASDYSTETGGYALRRLAPGDYSVRITPLDGDVGGFPLTPEHVSARLLRIADTNFEAEWWSSPESDRDDPTLRGTISLAAGQVRGGIDITTNVDTMPPAIAGVLPADVSTGIPIDSPILVRFTEPVIPSTLKEAFRLERVDPPGSIGGGGQLIGGREFVFAPEGGLEFGHAYRIRISTKLTDRSGLPIAAEFASGFITQDRPRVALTGIQPAGAPLGSIVTLTGVGFDPAPGAVNKVLFTVGSGVQDSLDGTSVTPTSLVVTVPANAVSGPVTVVVAGPETSNPRSFTVLPPGPLLAPIAGSAPARLDFAPTDAVLSPDGLTALVVGDGGFASVDLAAPTLPVTVHSPAAARSIALTPDGARAVITRPLAGEVVVVNAARGSGTFGQPIALFALSGTPGGVAVSPDGARAFVTDAAGAMVRVLDIDPASVAPYTERHQIALPGTALSGGVAVDPRGGSIILTSSDRGLLAVDLASDSVVVLNPTPNSGGVAIPPSGAEVLAPGGSLISSLITASLPDAVSIPGEVILGGTPRDVAVHPQGRSALVVNSLFDELQVVDIDAGSATYHQAVARVATGRSPIAIAVSSSGGVIAVANYGDRTLSIYTTGGADASLRRVIPDVASAGDLVGIETANPAYGSGAQADLGAGLFPATNATASGVGLQVPAAPGSQRATSLTLQDPTGTRSLSLPFRIVDPIPGLAPKLPPLGPSPAPADCIQGPGLGAVNAALRLSPDGRVIALARNYDACTSVVRLFRTSAIGDDFFSGFLAEVPVGEGEDLVDLAFTPDSRRLYVATLGSGLRLIDSDPVSPQFGQQLPPPPDLLTPGRASLATDPLGRYVLAGGTIGVPAVTLLTPQGALVDTVLTLSEPSALATTGDGRYLVAGMTDRAQVIDLSLRNSIAITPLHAGIGPALSVAVVGNGGRAVGLFPNSNIAVWNLDPLAGAIGAELYFGNTLPIGPVSHLVPAPDGDGVLAGSSAGGLMFKLEPGVVPPGVQAASLGQTSARIARSPDGRQLWVAERDTSASMGGLRMFSLSEATVMDLVSGAGQSARAGGSLPLPIQVRLSDAAGRPQVGVVVTFVLQGSDPGRLDGLPVGSLRRITDVDGQAKVQWTLGGTVGPASMQVLAQGVPDSVSVDATVVATDAEIVPQVIQLGPEDGARDVNAGTAVFARFNQPMDPAGLAGRMSVLLPSGPVAGTLDFEEGGRVAIFRPLRALPFSTECRLEVPAGATDLDGQATTGAAASVFTTEPPPPVQLAAIGPPAASVGATIVLEGEGFSPVASQNLVLFNGRLAPVTRATSTSIVTSVPSAATSGPVTVIVGAATSNERPFEVLVPTTTPGESLATIPVDKSVSDVAITPDGVRAYVTSPTTNGVSVLDIKATERLATITVGLRPQGIVILPDGMRAYVANTGSHDVSVIDTDPSGAHYNTVIDRIPVGEGPVDLVTSAIGPSVYVANSLSGTVSVIDANTHNGTYNRVVKTVNAGSGASSLAITPDGARLYVGTSAGLVMVDLASQVVRTVNAGSAASSITITPDGTLVLALYEDGQLIVVDASPSSATFNRVVKTVNAGSGASSLTITPDGALAFVTSADGNVVLVYQIVKLSSGAQVTTLPGAAVTLTLIATIPVGDGPVDIAVDPSHNQFALVTNAGSGTVTVIGVPTSLPPVPVEFVFSPGSLNLGSGGKWVTCIVEPPVPFLASDIAIPSIRLNGVVAPDLVGPLSIGDQDGDGLPDLSLKFDRAAVQLILPPGAQVPVRIEGMIGPRTFLGRDTIKVKVGMVTHPQAGETVNLMEPYTVRWVMPDDLHLSRVALVHSLDHGATWTLDASRLPNTGSAAWSPPAVISDSVLVAVVDVHTTANDTLVTAVVGVSAYFRLTTPVAVDPPPARLEFSPIRPNPSKGLARLRFGLPQQGRVDLALFDVQGRRLAVLVAEERAAGWHEVTWDGRTEAGGSAGAGLYFARLRAGGREFRQRLIWIR